MWPSGDVQHDVAQRAGCHTSRSALVYDSKHDPPTHLACRFASVHPASPLVSRQPRRTRPLRTEPSITHPPFRHDQPGRGPGSRNSTHSSQSLRTQRLHALREPVVPLPCRRVADMAAGRFVFRSSAAGPLRHEAKLALPLAVEEHERVVPSLAECCAEHLRVRVAAVLAPIPAVRVCCQSLFCTQFNAQTHHTPAGRQRSCRRAGGAGGGSWTQGGSQPVLHYTPTTPHPTAGPS